MVRANQVLIRSRCHTYLWGRENSCTANARDSIVYRRKLCLAFSRSAAPACRLAWAEGVCKPLLNNHVYSMLKKTSLICTAILVLLCFVVPYAFLSDVNAWYGSFLFWTLCGLLTIGLNLVSTHDFSDFDDTETGNLSRNHLMPQGSVAKQSGPDSVPGGVKPDGVRP